MQGRHIKDLRFAVDVGLLAGKAQCLQDLLTNLRNLWTTYTSIKQNEGDGDGHRRHSRNVVK